MKRRSTSPLGWAAGCAALVAAGGAFAATLYGARWEVEGPNVSDGLGFSVACAGDVDGDGTQDVVSGTPQAGYALVLSGVDGSTIHTMTGSASDEYGYAVAGVGDLDGDGCDDFAVGAPSESGTGAVHVVSGKSGKNLWSAFGDNGGDYLGCSVDAAGDVDGDGVGDVIVGARFAQNTSQKQFFPGMARVLSGADGSTLHTVWGDSNGDEFGSAVCRIADVDGDGYAEFAAGAEYGADGNGRNPGYVKFCDGATGKPTTTVYGGTDADSYGNALANVGDVDGDKVPDVAVGARWGAFKGSYPGYVELLSGNGASSIRTFYGDADSDEMGFAVAGGHDVDGDGVPDVVVGAPLAADDSGTYTGNVRVFSGSDGSTLETYAGAAADDYFGYGVALLPGLNGDGLAGIAVGMAGADGTGGTDADLGVVAVLGTAGPSGTLVIADGAPATNSRDVALQLTWEAGGGEVTQMRLRDGGGAWGEWQDVAADATWTVPATDGTKRVEAQFRDTNGAESQTVGDDIVLDTVAPTGSLSINAGANWTNSSDVALGLTSSDGGGTGVAQVEIRNGTSGPWTQATAAPSLPWTLTAGAGAKTVEVRFHDLAGNVSAAVSDTISVDLSAPTGSIVIAFGAAVVANPSVTLSLPGADTGGSGLSEMRLRRLGVTQWQPWRAYQATFGWTLTGGDGENGIEVQYRDAAGNESAVAADTVILDAGVPTCTASVRAPKLYWLPAESVGFDVTASDPAGGTGVTQARTTFDGGTSWSPWADLVGGEVYVPARPALAGAVQAQIVVRDGAGNESSPTAPMSLFFLDPASPDIGSGGTSSGPMSGAADVDVIGLDLVKGDVLTATVKPKSAKKTKLQLALDLAGPDGTLLVTDRHPSSARAAGIAGFVAPATGRYLLVVRNGAGGTTTTGTYSLKVAVKHMKPNSAGGGTAAEGSFTFDAANGSTLTGTLAGAGLDPASVVVEGPGGAVAVTTKLVKGKLSILPAKLTAGTGTYTVRFTATGPVTFTWKALLAKPTAKLVDGD